MVNRRRAIFFCLTLPLLALLSACHTYTTVELEARFAASRAPLAGATVAGFGGYLHLNPPRQIHAVTDAAGRCTFEVVKGKMYFITIESAGNTWHLYGWTPGKDAWQSWHELQGEPPGAPGVAVRVETGLARSTHETDS